jgi:polysaccharide biosynthesis protein PslG
VRSTGSPTARLLAALLALVLATVALAAAVPAGAASTTSASSRPQRRSTAAAPAAVPQGFVGVDVDGPMFGQDNSIDFDRQVGSMVTNGVQSIRVAFNWAAAEPYESWQKVPAADRDEYVSVAGKPFSFAQTDAIVGAAAQHDVTVLPTVLYTPGWDARNNKQGPINIPRRSAPYGGYLSALIGRYGPRGTFWRANPQIRRLPIRSWQIWNEENLTYYWPQPFAASYAGLLRSAHAAIHKADPGAKLVLGALTNVAWKSIGQLYRIRGAARSFDVVSVNGFTEKPSDVIQYMQFMRNAMNHFKDNHKPLLATEVSWPSARGHSRQTFDFDTTEAGQARDIAALLPMIGASYRRLGLIGFYYYTWMGDEGDPSLAFNYAGLLRFRRGSVTIKPALAAYRKGVLALEHCRRKGSLASSCIK